MQSAKQHQSLQMSFWGEKIPFKAMSRKELATLYGISVKTLGRYLDKQFENKYKGVRLFMPKDLQKIFDTI